jgi:tyrosinase
MRNQSTYDNMEAIHDAIHRAVGGDWWNDGLGVGTMYWTPAAAFDPIFWMHHAMVDRLFAMWQVLYPDNWLLPAGFTETWTLWEADDVDGNTRELALRLQNVLGFLLMRSSINAVPRG